MSTPAQVTAVVRLTLVCAKYRGAHLCDSVNSTKPDMGHVSYYSKDMSEHSPLPGTVHPPNKDADTDTHRVDGILLCYLSMYHISNNIYTFLH